MGVEIVKWHNIYWQKHMNITQGFSSYLFQCRGQLPSLQVEISAVGLGSSWHARLKHQLLGFLRRHRLQLHLTVQCQIDIKIQSTVHVSEVPCSVRYCVFKKILLLFRIPAGVQACHRLKVKPLKKWLCGYCMFKRLGRQIFNCRVKNAESALFVLYAFCMGCLNHWDLLLLGILLKWEDIIRCHYLIQLVQYKCNGWDILHVSFNGGMISSPGLLHPHTLTLCMSTVLSAQYTHESNLEACWWGKQSKEGKANQSEDNFWAWLI